MKVILRPETEQDYRELLYSLSESFCPDSFGLNCPKNCCSKTVAKCYNCWNKAIRGAE